MIDPKDSPFAIFQFHYRSRKNLQLLNIIPMDEPKQLSGGCPGDSLVFGAGPVGGTASFDGNTETEQVRTDVSGRKTPDQFPLGDTITLLPMPTWNSILPQPSKVLRDGPSPSYLQRPLPELPTEEHGTRSRSSSVSEAPSLTPSVAQYVDNGLFGEDPVEVGVTKAVRYTRLTERPHDILVSRTSSLETVGGLTSGS